MDTEFDRHQISRPRSFADKVAGFLRTEIESGRFLRGERLPTETQLGMNFGVSRTVIREAIGMLKHDGVLESYQGRGIFVATNPTTPSFRLEHADVTNKSELEQILEFLIANEVAATGLAAARRSSAESRRIRKALVDMEKAIERDETGTNEDVAFHGAIAAATRNPFFISFNHFLEHRIRNLIRTARTNSKRAGYATLVHQEHCAIYDAIEARDADRARQAAERHLRNAAARLRGDWSPKRSVGTG